MSDIENGADIAVVLTDGDRRVFQQVDETIEQSILRGDLQPAMSLGRAFRRSIQANGLALAKLLYRVEESWELFKASGVDDEIKNVFYSEIGVAPSTVYKYINMWRSVFANPDIPDETKRALEGKPMKGLLLLTAAARNGELGSDDWQRVSGAATSSEIRHIVRDIRGDHTSSNSAITIEMNSSNGMLRARQGEYVTIIGVLNIGLISEDKIADAAISRVINNCNIMEY